MKYILKNKKLFAVVMLVVMMSSVLVLPASALLNYGMGGVSFVDEYGNQYGEGYIWNSYDNPYELNGRVESNLAVGVEIWVFATARDWSYPHDERYVYLSDYGNGTSWATASISFDSNIHEPLQASADFVINGEWQTYDYDGGWNWGY